VNVFVCECVCECVCDNVCRDELPGMWTDCHGDCASNWTLLSEIIDSGVGHGPVVDVNLYV
jgi:hypothetical protein